MALERNRTTRASSRQIKLILLKSAFKGTCLSIHIDGTRVSCSFVQSFVVEKNK